MWFVPCPSLSSCELDRAGESVPEPRSLTGAEVRIAVGGCVAQLEGTSILERSRHVDVLVGTHNLHRVPALVEESFGAGGPLVELLGQRYRDAGIADVTVRLYADARHEILNETNRDEVTADIIAWLQAHAA